MQKISLTLSLIFCLTGAAAALPDKLGCKGDLTNPKVERVLIADRAAGVVQRISKHRLTVQTNNGPKDFYDEPPYDEQLAGVHHYFCDRREGIVLLMMNNQTLFTGLLVNEATGKITPGGESVWLSQDRRAYLASEQPDGMDGNVWSVYSIDGRKSWSGYNFIEGDGATLTAEAYLSDPVWTANGELTAEATCARNVDKKWQVKLVKKAGVWDWKPRKFCGYLRPG